MNVVQTIGGTEPVYYCVCIMNGMFRMRVSFNLFLDSREGTLKHIDVTGMMRPTLVEAEDEVSAAALQELQHGYPGICITDVSRTFCREMERRCHEILANANGFYDIAKLLLSDWENDMNKSESCYRPIQHEPVQRAHHARKKINSKLRADVADQLFKITSGSYVKLMELASEIENMNIRIKKEHECISHYFDEHLSHQVYF
jgi:hypothetical protein